MNLPMMPAGFAAVPAWTGWGRLAREARDALFQLVVIAWAVAPHMTHLAAWCSALACLMLFWRGWIAVSNGPLPGRGAVIAVMLIAAGLTLLTERTLLGKEAGVTMLVVLLSLKMLEMRGRRDALVVFFLGFFLVLTQCLYSQSLWIGLSMAVSTWGLLTAQVLSSMPVGKPPLKRAAGIAARCTLLGLPLMLALFLLFPRIGPLWGLPQDAIGRTGLSGSMRMGEVAALANDDAIAFRVRFEGASPPSSALYFRGPVLTQFDGTEWRSTAPQLLARRPAELRLAGPSYDYEMILEPIRVSLLPLLEATPPPTHGGPLLDGWNTHLDSDLRWQSDRLIAERVRLQARAWPRFSHGPLAMDPSLVNATLLPEGSNPRSLAWARQLRNEPRLANATADQFAAELMRHIATEPFSYTLSPGVYGADAIDDFWFNRRKGFCEHFAAAFVVMMRGMGIPARVVTGYQGAEAADTDGWQVVRQNNAHAWAEYWVSGRGWTRADPTAAVAPERVNLSRPLAPPTGLVAGALNEMNPALAEQIRRTWERLDNRWNQWVMSYSRTSQFDLLHSLGFEEPNWRDLVLVMSMLISVAATAAALWAWIDKRRIDPWVRLHTRLRESLSRLGVETLPHDGPRAMAARLRAQQGAPADALANTLDSLDRLRYGPQGQHVPGADWVREFETHYSACRRQLRGGQPSIIRR
jgi:transglutaminase-like putative cysteine protease